MQEKNTAFKGESQVDYIKGLDIHGGGNTLRLHHNEWRIKKRTI